GGGVGGRGAAGAVGVVAQQQFGGGSQQRAAHGPGAAPPSDAGSAGPQASVLEPAALRHGASEGAQPVPTAGAEVAGGGLVGVTAATAAATPRATVRASFGRLRKSL